MAQTVSRVGNGAVSGGGAELPAPKRFAAVAVAPLAAAAPPPLVPAPTASPAPELPNPSAAPPAPAPPTTAAAATATPSATADDGLDTAPQSPRDSIAAQVSVASVCSSPGSGNWSLMSAPPSALLDTQGGFTIPDASSFSAAAAAVAAAASGSAVARETVHAEAPAPTPSTVAATITMVEPARREGAAGGGRSRNLASPASSDWSTQAILSRTDMPESLREAATDAEGNDSDAELLPDIVDEGPDSADEMRE